MSMSPAEALVFTFETWAQYRFRKVKEIRAEYQCPLKDAMDTVSANGPWYDEWWNSSLDAMEAGATPTQAWVNLYSGHGTYTRWEQWLKHRPSVFDRLAKAGLSLYYPKKNWKKL